MQTLLKNYVFYSFLLTVILKFRNIEIFFICSIVKNIYIDSNGSSVLATTVFHVF